MRACIVRRRVSDSRSRTSLEGQQWKASFPRTFCDLQCEFKPPAVIAVEIREAGETQPSLKDESRVSQSLAPEPWIIHNAEVNFQARRWEERPDAKAQGESGCRGGERISRIVNVAPPPSPQPLWRRASPLVTVCSTAMGASCPGVHSVDSV